MSIHLLRKVRLSTINEASFAVSASFSGRDVRAVSQPVVSLVQDSMEDSSLLQRLAPRYARIMGLKNKSKLQFSTHLRGTGTGAGDDTGTLYSNTLPECQLLKNCFGSETVGSGSVVVGAGATTTVIPVGTGSNFSEGQAVLIEGEAAVITDVTANDLTLSKALSSAPSASTVVYASTTYAPALALDGTLAFQVLGAESESYTLLGCQGVVKLSNLNPGQLPKLDFDFAVAKWIVSSAESMGLASYTNTALPSVPGLASELHVQDNGTTTRNIIDVSDFKVEAGLGIEGIASVSGVEGLQGYGRNKMSPTLEFTSNSWSDDWRDDYEAQTAKVAEYQIGSTPGSTVLIEVVKFQITKTPERSPVNSQLGTKVAGEAIEGGSTNTDIAQAALRLHLL